MAMGSTPIPGCRAYGPRSVLVFGLGGFLDHPPPAIETVRRNAVTQMSLARLRIARQRRLPESVMRAVHAASRRCLAAFLNGHGSTPEAKFWQILAFQQVPEVGKRPVRFGTGRCTISRSG